MEREMGLEPTTSSLGSWATLWYQQHNPAALADSRTSDMPEFMRFSEVVRQWNANGMQSLTMSRFHPASPELRTRISRASWTTRMQSPPALAPAVAPAYRHARSHSHIWLVPRGTNQAQVQNRHFCVGAALKERDSAVRRGRFLRRCLPSADISCEHQ